MTPNEMTQCEFFLVQYVPSPGAELRLPIGLILLDGAGRLVRHGMMRQWKTVRCLDPRADLALLESLSGFVDRLVAEDSQQEDGSLRRSLVRVAETNWGTLQITPPQGVETEDPAKEFDRLFGEHVEAPRPVVSHAAAARPGTRRWIQGRLRESLDKHQLRNRLRQSIPVEEFTVPGDGFRIDYAYRPNGTTKYLHALSLEHDWNQAKVLSYTFGWIRERSAAGMTAIVADVSAKAGADLAAAQSCQRILLDSEIAVQPLSGLDGFLDQIGRELGPIVL